MFVYPGSTSQPVVNAQLPMPAPGGGCVYANERSCGNGSAVAIGGPWLNQPISMKRSPAHCAAAHAESGP